MAPSRKSRREKTRAPETPMAWKLPADLLHEIIARSDLRTLIRCAATCNLLRSDILTPPFDRRITLAAPCILAYMCADANKPLALAHPATPAASSFCHKHLSRFLTRKAARTFLGEYKPVSSRRGLVILRRLNIENWPKADRCLDLCVYDPMSSAQSFFSNPPEIRTDRSYDPKYVLVTAADGIDCSFLLLVFEYDGSNMRVHTASSCGIWERHDFPWKSFKMCGDPAILRGTVIHWLPSHGKEIITYDLGTRKTGSVKLPPPTNGNVNHYGSQLYLATSSDRKVLKLFAIQGFMMYVWLQIPVSAADGSGWSLEAVIDMEEELRSLDPCIIGDPNRRIEFEGSGKSTGEVLFLVGVRRKDYTDVYSAMLIVFDLETKKMHKQKPGLSLLEIDLPSRLQSMKIFS